MPSSDTITNNELVVIGNCTVTGTITYTNRPPLLFGWVYIKPNYPNHLFPKNLETFKKHDFFNANTKTNLCHHEISWWKNQVRFK